MEFKIYTQNLHCLVEENIQEKQQLIADKIVEYKFDIIFLQEVAQTKSKSKGIAKDNYGLTLKKLVEAQGETYYYYYDPIKESFGIYDEGVGILSRVPLSFVESKFISKTIDYSNWKTRKVLVYQLKLPEETYYLATTHFGWSDGYEVFEEQFDLAIEAIPTQNKAIIAGDFNIEPNSKEYKHIMDKKWFDIFANDEYFNRLTFRGDEDTLDRQTRLDYIMTNKKAKLLEREILFINPRVSDHYGVYAKIEY